jgi:hypothetical protein
MFVLAEEKRAGLLIRASADRVLAEKEVGKLWAKMVQQPLAGQLTLQITRTNSAPPGKPRSRLVHQVNSNLPGVPTRKLPPVTFSALVGG